MGIPQYYRDIIKDYPLVIDTTIQKVIWLYFDINGLIYWALRETQKEMYYSLKNHNSFQNTIIRKFIERIKQLYNIVLPTEGVGFFVDGPAPRAKMKQQVQRRFKTPYEEQEKEKIRIDEGEPSSGLQFDKNAFTPGTVFMEKLGEELHILAQEYQKTGLTTIVSTSNEAGEGEHKIFNYIKRNKKTQNRPYDETEPSETEKIVIVGLDADLIMLSLVTHFDNIYLMRESTEFGIPGSDNDFTYLDINLFRRFLVSKIRNEIMKLDPKTKYIEEKEQEIIDDYIFMCFLLGNDFVPHSPILSIRDGAVNKLIGYYVSAFNETNQHLVTIKNRNQPDKTTATINFESLQLLIDMIAVNEDRDMNKVYKKRIKLNRYPPRLRKDNPTNLDVRLHQLYYKPVMLLDKELKLEIDGNPGWEGIYYSEVLRLDRSNNDNITDICRNYLEGLDWVLQYYYTENHSWGWIYQHYASPIFQDLAIYMDYFNKIPKEQNKRMEPYTPFHQLMMVLPKTSSHLLPAPLAKYMTSDTSPLKEYYPNPSDMEFNYFFHVCFWETEPLIKLIDEHQVELIINKVKNKLTPNQKDRNTLTTMKIYS